MLARNYSGGVKWTPAVVVAKTGPVSYTVETSDHLIWRRHVDQLLPTAGSCDDEPQELSLVPDLEFRLEQQPSSEEPQNPPSGTDNVPGLPPPALMPTSGVTPSPEFTQSSPRDPMTEPATGRIYPRRNRRPPDRLSL